MATITERLQALGIGVKSDAQKERDASPVLSAMSQRRQPTFEEIQEQERLNRASGVTFPRYQGNVALSAGEKLRNIGGLTYVVPATPPAAPINTTGIDLSADIRTPDSPIPPMSADGMGGYSQGGMFSPPVPPARPGFTPQRPDSTEPVQQANFGMGMRTQDIIPVQPPTLDTTIADLMGRYKGLYGEDIPAPTMPDFTPTRQSIAPPMPSGLFEGVTPQLPQPQMPNLSMQTYTPDMFRGQLPMPRPTQYTNVPDTQSDTYTTTAEEAVIRGSTSDMTDEEFDAYIDNYYNSLMGR